MSMFSAHYIIATGVAGDRFYWTGADPDNPLCWGEYEKAVRFHTKASAEAVLDGVLCFMDKSNVSIVEDE